MDRSNDDFMLFYSTQRRRVRETIRQNLAAIAAAGICEVQARAVPPVCFLLTNELPRIDDSVVSVMTSSMSDSSERMPAEIPVDHVSVLQVGIDDDTPYHKHLPKDGRTLLQTPRNYEIKTLASGGNYYHFGIETGIHTYLQYNILPTENKILLQFNIDRFPLFKSSNTEFWPILCLLKNSSTKPFIVGLSCGKKKPAKQVDFLHDFLVELQRLLTEGSLFNGVHFTVLIDCFVCDAPARAYLKNTKSHNSYFGCEKC
jgi:hypothetical protein